MKHIQRLLPAFLCLFSVVTLQAQVTNDYKSTASGNWSSTSTWLRWNGSAWVTATSVPSSTGKVTISTGTTVTITGTTSFRDSLIIESGAVLNSSLSSPSGNRLNPFSSTAVAYIKNDGTFGSAGSGDGITLQTSAGPALIITGGGYSRITKFVPRAAVTIAQTITIDQDMIFSGTGQVFSAYANSSGCSTSEHCTLTINTGKTVRIPAGAFHIYNASTTPNPNGSYTYNINGTLDLSGSTATSSLLPFTSNTSSALTFTVNGTVKSGAGWVMASTSSPGFGGISCIVNSGGVFDASATTTLTTATGANGTFFVLNGGAMKRYSDTDEISFPIGVSASSYSPLLLKNSAVADSFTVSVKNTFDHTLPDTSLVIRKQWSISEAGSGAIVSVKLGWQTPAQAVHFSVDSTVNIMSYQGSDWRNYQSFMTGSGTATDPYFAVLGTSLSSFATVGVTNYTGGMPQQLAFPTAEGAGRFTTGGRGGEIYYVTNLNDTGAGSLRDAVSQPGRTVLFKVSGLIHLKTRINIASDNITVAGQTAPGDGISVVDENFTIKANNVIVRYMRCHMGDSNRVSNDAMSLAAFYHNVVVDHCSMSWSTDEAGSFYGCKNTTVQWSMVYESMYNSYHNPPEAHGFGGIWGGQKATFHHNLMAHNHSRNPRFSGSMLTGESDKEYVDFRNNVIYNWGAGGTYGGEGSHTNMVNNYYKAGPATRGTSLTVAANNNNRNRILTYTSYSPSVPDTTWGGKFFIDGNYVYGFPAATADNWTYGVHPDGSVPQSDSLAAAARQSAPFPFEPVRTQSAEDAYVSVTDSAGALLPRRDTLDRRIMRETKTQTATFEGPAYAAMSALGLTHPSGIIDSQNNTEGIPFYCSTFSSTTAPDDSDNDGMPDWWETMNGLNNSDADDRNAVAANGYTNLENYLNGIPSPDQNVLFTSFTGNKVNDTVNHLCFDIDWAKSLFQFGLYKSTDSIHFTQLKTINTNINAYQYCMDDSSVTGTTYYKIGSYKITGATDTVFSKIIKIDSTGTHGPFVSNPVTTVNTVSADASAFKVYPNPASGSITVQHGKLPSGSVLEIYDASGRKIGSYAVATGTEQTRVRLTGYAKGAYFLACITPSGYKKTITFIVK